MFRSSESVSQQSQKKAQESRASGMCATCTNKLRNWEDPLKWLVIQNEKVVDPFLLKGSWRLQVCPFWRVPFWRVPSFWLRKRKSKRVGAGVSHFETPPGGFGSQTGAPASVCLCSPDERGGLPGRHSCEARSPSSSVLGRHEAV